MTVVEVVLSKNTIDKTENSYALHIGDRLTMPEEVDRQVMQLIQQGYTVLGIQAREVG
jgi:hypothetical protein